MEIKRNVYKNVYKKTNKLKWDAFTYNSAWLTI